jgi:hypothetical protein
LLLLAGGSACALNPLLTRSPDPAPHPGGLERLPPICPDEPKPKKTFWQRLFPPPDERAAHALPEDDRWHWGELGGG